MGENDKLIGSKTNYFTKNLFGRNIEFEIYVIDEDFYAKTRINTD
jgi:hypothetical protein